MKFRIYEIEHGGDEQASVADLERVGFKSVRVLARDYDGSESIVVEAQLPPGASFNELCGQLEVAIT